MNLLQHFKSNKKEGLIVATLSILPDIFVIIRKIIPIRRVKQFCLNMHNTKESVEKMYRINKKLGRAWELHRKQDLETHFYTYKKGGEMERVPKDCILLFSGGLDSFITWRLLGQPKAVYFAIGHKAEKKELEKLSRIKERFGGEIIIDHSLSLGKYEMENGYIPYRNLFFLMLASYYSPNIVLAQILEYAPDKNQQFYRMTEKLLRKITTGAFQQLTMKKVKVWTPFSHYTKTELVREYGKRFDPRDLTEFTVSCYSGKEKNCGRCNACFSRYVAMKNNGIEEEYEVIPSVQDFKKKWHIKDFKLSQVKMYIKRWLEIRKMERMG